METDESLASRVQQGDDQALGELIERYEKKLLRYGSRFLGSQGEDAVVQAVQDIFIRVYQNIASFDTRQRFSPWIYRVAHNTFVSILRQRTRQPVYGIDFDSFFPHPVHEDSERREKEHAEIRVVVEAALSSLSAAHREIIVLYYFEELSYQEIADVLRIPVSTVGVRLSRARERLKRILPESSELPL
ncbi:MAG: RNA polymerase sigma factor [Bacillota bacterium]